MSTSLVGRTFTTAYLTHDNYNRVIVVTKEGPCLPIITVDKYLVERRGTQFKVVDGGLSFHWRVELV